MTNRGGSFNLRESPGYLLRRSHQRSRQIFDELIGARTGLSRQQIAVLIGIDRHPHATQARLSDETGFDRNTLAELMNRLIGKKLVERKRAQGDARAYEVSLSSTGAALVRGIYPRVHQVQDEILAPLPASLRPVFLRCLRILSASSEPHNERESNGNSTSGAKRATRKRTASSSGSSARKPMRRSRG